MSIARIAQSMRARMPWPVARNILQENDIARSHGWDQTVKRLIQDAGLQDMVGPLTDALIEHIICGEKIVTLYPIERTALERARESLAEVNVSPTPFSKSFPYSLSEEDLAKVPLGMSLAAIVRRDDGIAVIFSSVRVVTVREPIGPDDIPPSAVGIFEEYEEIVGLRTVRWHACDVIWVPHEGDHIDARVDFPLGTPVDVAATVQANLVKSFNDLLGSQVLSEAVNLFALIDRIYSDANEGVVVELGFGTTTASLKHEKMRRRMLDLRDEMYHKGGKAALKTPIEPFRISVVWRRRAANDVVSKPELSVNGSARSAAAKEPNLQAVIIRKCMGFADYDFVRSRIEHHLAQEAG